MCFAHPAGHNFGSATFVPRTSRLLLCELRILPKAVLSQDAISCERKKSNRPLCKSAFALDWCQYTFFIQLCQSLFHILSFLYFFPFLTKEIYFLCMGILFQENNSYVLCAPTILYYKKRAQSRIISHSDCALSIASVQEAISLGL